MKRVPPRRTVEAAVCLSGFGFPFRGRKGWLFVFVLSSPPNLGGAALGVVGCFAFKIKKQSLPAGRCARSLSHKNQLEQRLWQSSDVSFQVVCIPAF